MQQKHVFPGSLVLEILRSSAYEVYLRPLSKTPAPQMQNLSVVCEVQVPSTVTMPCIFLNSINNVRELTFQGAISAPIVRPETCSVAVSYFHFNWLQKLGRIFVIALSMTPRQGYALRCRMYIVFIILVHKESVPIGNTTQLSKQSHLPLTNFPTPRPLLLCYPLIIQFYV